MKEIIAVVGWVVGVQGGLGVGGRVFGDEPWGLLHKWWDVPTPLYVVLFVGGVSVAVYAEVAKKRKSWAA
ncbi:hypothetical protein CP970_18655 [Streptomyces kanamyceticus]|uniref:Uncharacterized protein n=1 Tax=Streptomyces kanamyceticus TaxID=1967 RepID=A0A5J6GCI6_STRKN|nr:hypothetical protein [Streptomyces kanamyceticus]QEU92657.1 hypothetical protein CP970_18655 [Streptomyces kanamyceticus]